MRKVLTLLFLCFTAKLAYSMVNAYGLKWDASGETAYPSTFVLDRKGFVRFAKISRSHGDRTKAADILEALKRVESD